jgi:hypothetical protein
MKMEPIETFEHNGKTVKIFVDSEPSNPRTEWDNLATFVCWHRRVNLGDDQIAGCSASELREKVESGGEEILAILPLYLYQHSGMTISTTPFSCPWDSGQVGWAYVTKANAEKMGCIGSYKDQETGETKEYNAEFFAEAIRGEVKTYDRYLTGEVYGYEVEDEKGDHLDSCWGFFDDIDYVRTEAKSAAEHAS